MSTGNLGKNLHVDVSQRPAYTSRPAMSHGLLGAQYVTQHMMIDDNWSIQQLIDQFDDVKRVMKTHETIKQIQKRAVTFRVDKVIRKLRTQVHNGRLLLNLHRYHTNKQVTQYLEGDKAKTRLYQKLPLHEISESIDHQTFVMRKEHDRLMFRKEKLEEKLHTLLYEKATLENHTLFQTYYEIEEGKKKAAFKKKLAASAIRLKAAQTINSTYKKIIEVLLKDATYYDVIIRSLVDDIKDQDNYVNYILDVGKPAFALFRVLSLNYVKRRDKVQKTLRKFNESLQRNTIKLRRGSSGFLEANATKNLDVFNIRERYERSSQSMRAMEKHLEIVTNMIRDLKTATLTSNSTKIYKTIKNQQPINRFMHKEIQLDDLRYKTMIIKKEINETARVIIYHNFNVPQMNMGRKAWLLKAAIEGQDMYGARISKHMKERSKLFVLIRFTLFHLFDMLRVVNAPIPRPILNYPNADLELPLLRFEQSLMFRPPAAFEENLERLMAVIKKKLAILMKRFIGLRLNEKTIEKFNVIYRKTLVATSNVDEDDDLIMFEPHGKGEDVETEDEGDLGKSWANVPNRQRIKQISAKVLEENLKRPLVDED
ncbi:uncharacterized protein ACN427_009235 isoform 1-T1 [Glossina fuscipes fuscipes]